MKSYIIYLPQFETSIKLATDAFVTAQDCGWEIELFAGVDGRTVADDANWHQYNVKINQADKKCTKLLNKAGVRGCFLSHYMLWKQCVESNEPIGIFEHDIRFLKSAPEYKDVQDILRLEGFTLNKARPAGHWYEGARAYILTPQGANKLISWINDNGCLPADVMLGDRILDIQLDASQCVETINQPTTRIERHTNSFTWNLEGMA